MILNLQEGTLDIQVDPALPELLNALTPKGWRRFGRVVSLATRKADRALLDLPLGVPRSISLNHLVFWTRTGEWLERGTLVAHKNGDPLDFRSENLRLMRAGESVQQLRSVTPLPVAEKGISLLPGGQFKVRAYDPVTKNAKYIGLRNTREEAVELKRAFLAGEVGFRSPTV